MYENIIIFINYRNDKQSSEQSIKCKLLFYTLILSNKIYFFYIPTKTKFYFEFILKNRVDKKISEMITNDSKYNMLMT